MFRDELLEKDFSIKVKNEKRFNKLMEWFESKGVVWYGEDLPTKWSPIKNSYGVFPLVIGCDSGEYLHWTNDLDPSEQPIKYKDALKKEHVYKVGDMVIAKDSNCAYCSVGDMLRVVGVLKRGLKVKKEYDTTSFYLPREYIQPYFASIKDIKPELKTGWTEKSTIEDSQVEDIFSGQKETTVQEEIEYFKKRFKDIKHIQYNEKFVKEYEMDGDIYVLDEEGERIVLGETFKKFTTVILKDGRKGVVAKSEDDADDFEKAVLYAYVKSLNACPIVNAYLPVHPNCLSRLIPKGRYKVTIGGKDYKVDSVSFNF